jgi:diguanylate cyclase (GGDEF)-like protein
MAKTLIWVQPAQGETQDLGKELRARGFQLVVSETPDAPALRDALPQALAIIADAAHLDAVTVMRERARQGGKRALPLVVTSCESALQVRLAALRHGADAFFTPPYDPAAVADRLEELTGTRPEQEPCKVMVVDDDPVQAEFAASILKTSGCEVCKVTESLKILDTLRQCEPELILMDVYMPDATGVELTSIIREQPDLMDIPIVYLSAEHDPEKQMDALSAGGEDFLTKPVSPKHLIATVRNRIDRARQLRRRNSPAHRADSDPALVRKHILELLERIHSTPSDGHATGLLYMELDTPILLLEQVNLEGIDRIMSDIQAIAADFVGTNDRVARFGDFCLVFIVQRKRVQDLDQLAERLKQSVEQRRFTVAGKSVSTSVSLGLRMLEDDDEDASHLINEAIRASHQARASGSGFHRLSKQRKQEIRDDTEQKDLVNRITDTDNLHILYQPIVPLAQEPVPLYQCLLRLRGADGGLLPAEKFLPAVEQTANILKLDRWVILKNLLALRKMGPRARSHLRLLVSQSPSALRDVTRTQWILETIEKVGVEPRCLVLEFPFPDIAADLMAARNYLEQLRIAGIGVSLNCLRELDALSRNLHRLPTNYVKITDHQIRNYPDTWSELVRKAHGLGKQVIVSRIEHPELLGQLWSHNVDYIQGNFIQHPGEDLNYDFTSAVLA